jgi:hypothetical protein
MQKKVQLLEVPRQYQKTGATLHGNQSSVSCNMKQEQHKTTHQRLNLTLRHVHPAGWRDDEATYFDDTFSHSSISA